MTTRSQLLTDEALSALERLDRIASAAPWVVNEQDGDIDCPDDGDHDSVGACDWSDVDKQVAIEARNALFDLTQEVRRLRETFAKFICCGCVGEGVDEECPNESLSCNGARRVLAGGEW